MSPEPEYHQDIDNVEQYKSLALIGLSIHYFWSESSGTSHIMTPIIDQLSAHYKERLFMYCIDIDQNNDIASHCGINQIPAILIYSGQQMIDRVTGIISFKNLVLKIDLLLDI